MPGTRAKRVASVTTVDAPTRKRVNRVTSNGSSRAEVDAELDNDDDPSESYGTKSVSAQDDSEELESQLGMSHNTSQPFC
jgi:hypothetical protein